MFRFKMYFPDEGLGEVFILSDTEFLRLIKAIKESQYLEEDEEKREHKAEFMVNMKEHRAVQPLSATQDFNIHLPPAYHMVEPRALYCHEKFIAKSNAQFKNRYLAALKKAT